MFTEDLTVFFDPSDFGETALIGGTTSVNGLFDVEYVESFDAVGNAPVFTCAAADVVGVVNGTALAIRSTDYVIRSQQPDGSGVVRMILEEQ